MKFSKFSAGLAVFLFFLSPWVVFADRLNFRFKHGDPGARMVLLNMATAQNEFKEPEKSAGEQFLDNLSRQVSGQMARGISDYISGNGDLVPGYYSCGQFSVDIVDVGNGVNITVIDGGKTTTVFYPFQQY